MDLAVHRGHGRVDVHRHAPGSKAHQGPHPLAPRGHHPQQGLRLHHPERLHIAPERGHGRESVHVEHAAHHGIVPDVRDVPQALESHEQQHEQAQHHAVAAQLGPTLGASVVFVEDLFELNEIQKLRQRQEPAERAQAFRALSVRRVGAEVWCARLVRLGLSFSSSRFFSCALGLLAGLFRLRLAFHHLGDLLCKCGQRPKPHCTAVPRWFPRHLHHDASPSRARFRFYALHS